MSEIWDLGLQPERTELAWRRTALSLALISVVAIRLLPVALESWLWVMPGVLGVLASGAIWWGAKRRYRIAVAALVGETVVGLPGASLLISTAVFTTGLGIAGLLLVVR